MNLSWLMVALVSTIVWAGFVLHTSFGDGLLLGKYSGSYAGLLAFLTIAWLGLNTWAWRQGRALSARLRGFFVSIGITLLLAALILPGRPDCVRARGSRWSNRRAPAPARHRVVRPVDT